MYLSVEKGGDECSKLKVMKYRKREIQREIVGNGEERKKGRDGERRYNGGDRRRERERN